MFQAGPKVKRVKRVEQAEQAERNPQALNFQLLNQKLAIALGVALCCALVFLPIPAFSHDLPTAVREALKQARIPESSTSIYVHEIGATPPLLAINAGVAMNPASVMKLVTTFAGLELLGPAYTWKTEVYADGMMRDDTLQGNLVIKGYGDPRLNLENFWLLTRRLRQTGLREIAGDLVLDSSHFDLPTVDPAAFDGKPHRSYNVPPEALLVNYRTLALRLLPQPESKTVRIVVDPLPSSLDLKNSLTLTNGLCSEWRDTLAPVIRTGSGNNGRASVLLKGSYSTDCGEKTLFLSVHDASNYTARLFRQLWEEQGGIFHGNVRSGTAPEGLAPLEIHQSPPLSDIVRDINKFSNNTAARQLYLALGLTNGIAAANATGRIIRAANGTADSESKPRATLAQSDIAVRTWLASRGLSFPELIIENGSGLSRNERISTHHLGALLLAAFQSPVMPEFISSLPIAAVDGTMKKRLNGSATAGQAHIKTGLLEGVKTMAGYVLDKSGRRMVVIFFVNHPKAGNAQTAMDALLDWVYERPR
ncbi:D-alanyl-D-alanine carboxypeptidase/D-alanyl-D-alanine-endopeptidase [Nitrosovibrio sp. Nv6]|uniref:D-alanyl-D-alanine carboxypeptidase/D-alanyl-D-alanine endopeptidase n=1 Tax=Nitrosovibrio sp. Nv6 TaxID=1855340 RepID=UPI0008BE0A64|nr:D-alanyl-D-alanine carboxypeptidase/D-alanyl-D-alanine-endopeptidase [Nitrosovibrio sp. Nv6]SEP41985.1 D-alanyl-D-alanine carboxypeptidase / D-alanyl-D-alanine-endopeptidase (penicillin-binding protein 4) [Nitrosovibrio sp. Nv6]